MPEDKPDEDIPEIIDEKDKEPSPPLQPEIPQKIQHEPEQIAQPIPSQVYIPRKTEAAEVKPSRLRKFKTFFVECMRVLRVTKKPDRTEFKTIVKISGIGMAVIGFIGFLIAFIKELFF